MAKSEISMSGGRVEHKLMRCLSCGECECDCQCAKQKDVRRDVAVADAFWAIMHLTPVTLMPKDHQDWLGRELTIWLEKLSERGWGMNFKDLTRFRAMENYFYTKETEKYHETRNDGSHMEYCPGCLNIEAALEAWKETRPKPKLSAEGEK